jgi:hypothetical protein
MAKRKHKEAPPGELLVCRNPKALKQYEIEERLEAFVRGAATSTVRSLRS